MLYSYACFRAHLSHKFTLMKKILLAGAALLATTPLLTLASNDSYRSDDCMRHGTGVVATGSTATGGTWSGCTLAGAKDELHGLHLALGKLSPADRAELIKLIRNFLTSKGVSLPTEQVKEVKQERKEMKHDKKEFLKEMKDRREALRAKMKELPK